MRDVLHSVKFIVDCVYAFMYNMFVSLDCICRDAKMT